MTFRPDLSPPETSPRANGSPAIDASGEQEAPTQPPPRRQASAPLRPCGPPVERGTTIPESSRRRHLNRGATVKRHASRGKVARHRRSLCPDTRGPFNRSGDQPRTGRPAPARSSAASTASSRNCGWSQRDRPAHVRMGRLRQRARFAGRPIPSKHNHVLRGHGPFRGTAETSVTRLSLGVAGAVTLAALPRPRHVLRSCWSSRRRACRRKLVRASRCPNAQPTIQK